MKVFILGGRGFVGSAFTRYCKKNRISHQVIHLQNYQDFVGKTCDLFINANGNSKKYLAETDPRKDFELSVLSVEKTFKDFDFGKYVFCSSIDMYNDTANTENNAEDAVIDPARLSFYGFHKYLAEQLVRRYVSDWLIIRFGGFVGEGLKKNTIFDLLHGNPLWVDIRSRYQYLDTDSAAQIVFNLIQMKKTKEIFNVCGNGTIAIEDAIKYLSGSFEIRYAHNSPSIEHYEINIDKLKSIIEVPETKETIERYMSQQE